MRGHGLDSSSLGQCSLAGSCEHDKELLGFTSCLEFHLLSSQGERRTVFGKVTFHVNVKLYSL
jgi:hypothetical protein